MLRNTSKQSWIFLGIAVLVAIALIKLVSIWIWLILVGCIILYRVYGWKKIDTFIRDQIYHLGMELGLNQYKYFRMYIGGHWEYFMYKEKLQWYLVRVCYEKVVRHENDSLVESCENYPLRRMSMMSEEKSRVYPC